MKKISVLAMLLLGATFLNAQDAASIVASARNRIQSNSIQSQSRMVITARNGRTSERVILQYSKDGPNGGRNVIVFLQPANIAGTRFLIMAKASGGSDQWVYLPDAKKLRQVAVGESNGNYIGTDFSFDDILALDRDASLDNHTILREEIFSGRQCYVIQSIPKDSSFQYSKTVSWIEKERFLSYKVELYNRQGEMVKIMEMSNFVDKQGRLTPMQTRISSVREGTSTTIYLEDIKYDVNIPDAFFTPTNLETWRVR